MTDGPRTPPADRARALALSLPGASEKDHHGFPSFRVGGKIFATLPEPSTLRVFVDEQSARAAVEAYPRYCSVVTWGAKVSGVAFDVDHAPDDVIADYLAEAWEVRAPAALRRSAPDEPA